MESRRLVLTAAILTDDELLIRRAFGEDAQKGCELLFRRYNSNLCNHAIRFVHSKEAAEDIVAEIFAVFWQNRIYDKITYSYRAYLYKAVRLRSYNYLKLEMLRPEGLGKKMEAVSADIMTPDQELQYTELHQKIERIIQQLPPQSRKAYLLKRVEGKKYDEIAHELQISSKAVEALVSRALSKLRSHLQGEWFLWLLFPGLLDSLYR